MGYNVSNLNIINGSISNATISNSTIVNITSGTLINGSIDSTQHGGFGGTITVNKPSTSNTTQPINCHSINIDHTRNKIITANGCLSLNDNGSVKVGNGLTLPDSLVSDYEGCIRFNESTKKLEYCDGNRWIELLTTNIESKDSIIYSLLF